MKLTVIMADTWRTCEAIKFENEWRPYGYRTIQFDLTPEQISKIEPKIVGKDGNKTVTEIILNCWLEN